MAISSLIRITFNFILTRIVTSFFNQVQKIHQPSLSVEHRYFPLVPFSHSIVLPRYFLVLENLKIKSIMKTNILNVEVKSQTFPKMCRQVDGVDVRGAD